MGRRYAEVVMSRMHLLGLAGVLGLAATFAACSASSDGGDGFDNGDGTGGGGNASGTGGSPADGDLGVDDDFDPTGVGGSSSSGGNPTCITDEAVDDDLDGLSEDAGDCNDCDPNVHPGSIEVIATADGGGGAGGGSGAGGAPAAADEDCDGMVDNVAPPCDTGLLVDDADPNSAAKAVELCQAAEGMKWGVLGANYVRANGAVIPANLAVGILPDFGPNVAVQGGERMLALSSGNARRPGDAGFCGSTTCTHNGAGTPPPGFPQDTSGCPGAANINDDVGFEVSLRSPKNATGYSFNFKFYSFEYPEWVCTSFNDQFITLVTPPPMGAIDGNISFDANNNPVSVNVAFFQVCPGCAAGEAELQGTGFELSAGATTWLQTTAPITGGEEFSIRWAIWDTGDAALDSTALVDNFQWVATGGTPSVGTEPIPDPK
jgi:hypothetical protein